MAATKESRDLRVQGSGLPTENVDASINFETEVQQTNMDRLWFMHVYDYNVTGNNPKLTLMVSTTPNAADFVPYKEGSTDIKISDVENRMIYDKDAPFIYFKWVYEANGASGTFSMQHYETNDG